MLFIQDADQFVPATAEQVVREALRLSFESISHGPVLTNPRAVREFLTLQYGSYEHEVFIAVWLDNRNQVICVEEMFRGTIDGATVHPREVVKAALKHNAAAVIFSHNHPSAITTPSQADEFITKRLSQALALVDIRVLDHIVVGKGGATSMSEMGLI